MILGGPRARIGGRAAGYLHHLVEDPPEEIVVMVPDRSPIRSRGPWHFQRERVGVRSTRSPGDPPRLTLVDTALDLCDAAELDEVIGILTRAVQTRRTSSRQLIAAANARPRLRRRSVVLGVLGDVAVGALSWLEVTYLRDVERAHGLPRGERQDPARGRALYLRDVLYQEWGLIVELDGRIGHEGEGIFRDMNRDNLAVLRGESSLRFGSAQVAGEPCEVAWQVVAMLRARGWMGTMTRCSRCVGVPDCDIA